MGAGVVGAPLPQLIMAPPYPHPLGAQWVLLDGLCPLGTIAKNDTAKKHAYVKCSLCHVAKAPPGPPLAMS